MTTTLHIQVPINDVSAFKTSFAEHAEVREQAGVRSTSVRHPVGDESLVIVDLDFKTAREAEAFLGYLRENVWTGNAVLRGMPEAKILEPVEIA